MITRYSQVLIALSLGCSAISGCGGDSIDINPVPVFDAGTVDATSDVTLDSESDAATDSTTDSAKVVRTVIVRKPWANFDLADNLALDGGFEFSGAMSNNWGEASYDMIEYGNGAVCRSGVRCAVLKASAGIYGFFVSPKEGVLAIKVHAKPAALSCTFLKMGILDSYDQQTYSDVKITKAQLATDGWCEIEGQVNALPYTVPILYLESSKGNAVIDDVSVLAATNASETQLTMAQTFDPIFEKNIRAAGRFAKELANRTPERRQSLRGSSPWTARFQPWLK